MRTRPAITLALALWACNPDQEPAYKGINTPPEDKPFEWLSQYNLFVTPIRDLKPLTEPGSRVLPYDLNTPLFSDYAKKARFIYVPSDKVGTYKSTGVFDFPEGTILVKNFYYDRLEGKDLIETRLLIRYASEWKAYAYVWNEDESDARLAIGGASLEMPSPDLVGGPFAYHVPNQNECKGCHSYNKKLMPIGPKAGNLNRMIVLEGVSVDQLDTWLKKGLVAGINSSNEAPVYPVWDNPATGSLDDRARAYLDVNCGHCHRTEGPANNTGLYLNIEEGNPTRLGFCKQPIAAGPGSGGRPYDIVPGDPDQSILLYRMESTEPVSRMPELGRELVHSEGVELIRQWIASLDPEDCN
ncbi:MAG TPA: SO2930 family diheme c-type cytochrome [Cyclobacteriaceae bacterium]